MDVEDLPESSEEARRLAEDVHLLDPGNLQEIALWIVSAAGAGVIGNSVFEVLKAVRKRFGAGKIDDLKKQVYEEIKDAQRRKEHLPARDLRLRVDQIFRDFDS